MIRTQPLLLGIVSGLILGIIYTLGVFDGFTGIITLIVFFFLSSLLFLGYVVKEKNVFS